MLSFAELPRFTLVGDLIPFRGFFIKSLNQIVLKNEK